MPHEDTAMAVGHPAPGIDGFRRTHRDARLAHGIAAVRPRPLTLYDDVALESFALQDELLAQDFVTRELGPLGGSDQRAARLRDTLRCYFDTSHNASAAASRLGVHERTVANRIRAIEDTLDRPVTARRAELETALRLHALFTA
jgi:DNA-binding PucR family transcriptional regulator